MAAYTDPYDTTPPEQNPYAPPAPTSPQATTEDLLEAARRASQGYNAAPATTNNWAYLGGGVNQAKLNDPTHNTPKYEVQRYLAQFDPMKLGRAGLLALTPEQRAGLERLGYQIRDEDKIFRNDIGEIDVLHGDRTQYGWRLTGVGNTPATKKPLPPVVTPPGPPLMGSSPYASGGAGAGAGGTGAAAGSYTPGGTLPPVPNRTPDYQAQFTDPLTRQYEEMLEAQKRLYVQQQLGMEQEGARQQGLYDTLMSQYQQQLEMQRNLQQQQQLRMQQEQATQEETRRQAQEARGRLEAYGNERVAKLQGPAYTGTEQEVIRTQFLDPIERDRQATQQRALDNIGSRGFDPSSGIAQSLIRDVDRGFDEQRSQAQGDIAYRQIQEQRSREQEAQALLAMLAELPQAGARGDLEMMQYLDSLITNPGMNTLAMSGQLTGLPGQSMNMQALIDSLINQPGQNALATSAMLSDLPVQRTQLGIQALGLGGQPQSGVPSALSLLQNAQNNRYLNQQNMGSFWQSIGGSLFR